jgi:hypothetical protein
MKKLTYTLFSVLFILVFSDADARNYRVAQVPNGTKFSCNTCHTNGGGTTPNDFGKLIQRTFLTQEGSQFNVEWGPLLASLDADNDGVSNGRELQDPYGFFMEGETAPGSSDLVTSAGIASSSPLTSLTVEFSEMNPHVGQTLWLRVYDRISMKEVGRVSANVEQNFTVNLDAVIPGGNYYVDFFSDHNNNGKYDAPPTDHAWRLILENAEGNDVLAFTHNTDFTDIEWPSLLTVNFTDMTPHVGQLLEIRVEDDLTSQEVGRKRIEFIPGAEFSVEFPGIMQGREYNIEMYADLNKNGIYDEPPADHAWEVKFENNTGDVSVNFAHNTDFKDVNWKYLYTLNFTGMNPHVSQLLEMRVYRNDNGEEVNRTSVVIPGPEFSLSIPQIEMDHDYNVDFYADHNGNGAYDPPGTDHAWRLTFNSQTGNFVQNFIHNTDFVDINWPGVTDVETDTEIPSEFVLNQNYPNPFNPTTTISFSLAETGNVSLEVYDILGRLVAELINEKMSSGFHQMTFNGADLNSGTYYYRISTDQFTEVRKMVLLK